LHTARVRRPRAPQLGVLEVVPAAVSVSEHVVGAQVRGRRVGHGGVQQVDHAVAHLLRELALGVDLREDLEASGKLYSERVNETNGVYYGKSRTPPLRSSMAVGWMTESHTDASCVGVGLKPPLSMNPSAFSKYSRRQTPCCPNKNSGELTRWMRLVTFE
jgi:hypothetical protein